MNFAQMLATGPKLRPTNRKALKVFVENEYLSVMPAGKVMLTEDIAAELNRTIMDAARYLRLLEGRGLVECLGRVKVRHKVSVLAWRKIEK